MTLPAWVVVGLGVAYALPVIGAFLESFVASRSRSSEAVPPNKETRS